MHNKQNNKKDETTTNNINTEWNIIEESKWNFIDNLNYKEKINNIIINKYNQIYPILYYSFQLFNDNNYFNIILNSKTLINTIKYNDIIRYDIFNDIFIIFLNF